MARDIMCADASQEEVLGKHLWFAARGKHGAPCPQQWPNGRKLQPRLFPEFTKGCVNERLPFFETAAGRHPHRTEGGILRVVRDVFHEQNPVSIVQQNDAAAQAYVNLATVLAERFD